MNNTHFGNSDASKILVEILEKNLQFKKKITSSFSEYNRIQNEIVNSDLSVKLKRNFLTVTLKRFQQKMKRFDGDLKTFSLNVLSQIYRKHINSL